MVHVAPAERDDANGLGVKSNTCAAQDARDDDLFTVSLPETTSCAKYNSGYARTASLTYLYASS